VRSRRGKVKDKVNIRGAEAHLDDEISEAKLCGEHKDCIYVQCETLTEEIQKLRATFYCIDQQYAIVSWKQSSDSLLVINVASRWYK